MSVLHKTVVQILSKSKNKSGKRTKTQFAARAGVTHLAMLVLQLVYARYYKCNPGLYRDDTMGRERCITADECNNLSNDETQGYAVKATMTCELTSLGETNPPTKTSDGSYECKDGEYLIVGYRSLECVKSAESCRTYGISDTKLILETEKICIYSEYYCNSYLGKFAYNNTTCVSYDECIANGNFIDRDTCVSASQCTSQTWDTFIYQVYP